MFRANSKALLCRWEKYDPENPPYRFGPPRTKKENHFLVIFCMLTTLVISHFLLNYVKISQERKAGEISNHPRLFMSERIEKNALMVEQALLEHEQKVRRKKLGLPPRNSGIVDIRDF